MSRLQFSKASLHKQSSLLKRYRQYLPSLDLKRQQLMAEKNKAEQLLNATRKSIDELLHYVEDNLLMLSDTSIAIEHLVNVKQVKTDYENVVGVELPRLLNVEISQQPYSHFCKPHWVDNAVIKLKEMLELQIRAEIEQERLNLLQHAVKKVTQRVNLFEKILIPRTRKNIRRIQIFLSDNERAAVVRAKITKQKMALGG
jgi:V/A-type H+/Na+-transporting ATPase subunit D